MSSLVAQSHDLPRGIGSAVPRILIVDDEQYMCDVCARTLRRSGYEVFTTSDPHAAVRLLNGERQFDLLLTDIKMPAMSGLDLAYIARDRDPAIAIIIMTGFASKENLQQSVQRGVADFLAKPFELEQLRIAVDQALHKRSLLQDNVRLRALEQLLASSKALSATLDLPELGGILLGVAMQQSGCRAGFVLIHQGAVPTVVVRSGNSSDLLSSGFVLAQQSADSRGLAIGSDDDFCRENGTDLRYALAMALQAQGEVSGILVLCDDRPTVLRPGVQEEIALLATHAGAALRNAYLYQQLGDAYQRLQELDRLKSEFISIASHELRTPLSIVLGYTMMVRDQTTAEHRNYLQRVLDNAQRIRDIVDDMVSLRHLETGEPHLNFERCILQDLVTQAQERMRQIADERKQQMSVELPKEPLSFLCDKEKVLLVLGHLISNAVKFTPEGGTITLRASLRQRGMQNEATRHFSAPNASMLDGAMPWAVVEVQDTGIGIPEREQPRIFERFYQVADSLTRDHGGTGLGLAIVRELVNSLGGAVSVVSHEGQGSTFAFALPYRQE